MKGIITYLKTKYGENLIEQGIIKIKDNGHHQHSSGSLSNLIKYDNQHIDDYYMNNNGNDPLLNSSEGWIDLDFNEKKINLTSCTIRNQNGYHLKSWKILGSKDENEWKIINQQTNYQSASIWMWK